MMEYAFLRFGYFYNYFAQLDIQVQVIFQHINVRVSFPPLPSIDSESWPFACVSFTRLWICVGRENGGQLSMLRHLSLSSHTPLHRSSFLYSQLTEEQWR